MQALSPASAVDEAGLQVHPLLETPQRSSAGDTAEGNKAWLRPLLLVLLLVIDGEKEQLSVCK